MSQVDIAKAQVAADDLRLEPVTANIGAIVHGLRVRDRHDDDVAGTLRRWLHERGVLFFDCADPISDEDFLALGLLFGEVYDYPYTRHKARTDDGLIAEIGVDEGPKATKYRDRTAAAYWHTDGSSQAEPPQAAVLTPLRLPSVGGDTMWASMTAAYDALSSHYQRMLDGLEAVHNTAAQMRHFSAQEHLTTIFGEGESFVHPAVIKDPVTGRKILYVNSNFTEKFVGMSDRESEQLLEMLFDHTNTPEFHVRLRWQPETVAVWEERVTQHRAVVDYTEPRKLRRMTLRGDRPAA